MIILPQLPEVFGKAHFRKVIWQMACQTLCTPIAQWTCPISQAYALLKTAYLYIVCNCMDKLGITILHVYDINLYIYIENNHSIINRNF